MNRVVPINPPHKVVPEGMNMDEIHMQLGNTKVIIDLSYVNNRTEEQKQVDKAMLSDAVWNLYDEMEEAI
jgi:hypothetical protein